MFIITEMPTLCSESQKLKREKNTKRKGYRQTKMRFVYNAYCCLILFNCS